MAISTKVSGSPIGSEPLHPSALMWVKRLLEEDEEKAAKYTNELIGAFVSAINQGIREGDKVGHYDSLLHDAQIMKDVMWGLAREAKNRPPF